MHRPSSSFSLFTTLLTRGLRIVLGGFNALLALALAAGGIRALQPEIPPPAASTAAPAPSPTPKSAAPVAETADSAAKERGKTTYMQVCFACHQPTGLGLPNMFPPLAGSDWVKAPKADRLIRIVIHGLMGPLKVNGAPFNTPAPMMPPQGAMLSDKQIADVLTYVRAEFGGGATAVTADMVKAVRDAENARAAMWSEAELQKIPIK